MFHPLCGYSLQKAAKVIAITDVSVAYLYFYTLSAVEQYEQELMDVISRNETDTVKPSSPMAMTWGEYHKLILDNLPSVDIMIVLGLCAAAFALVHLCIEIWLCRLLLKAAAHKDGSAIKIWFWVRLAITILFSLYSMVGILTVRTDILDWVFELVNIYRMYTLLIIYEFKKEVSVAVSMVKPR